MKYDQHFMLCYAKQLYNRRQYHTFITIEQDLSQQITSYDILYDLGNACYRLGKFSRAVEYYEKAHRMIPTRIAPLYRIFTIYRSEGCNAEAQEKAHQIIDLPVKISNSETLRAKSQAKTFLNEHQPDEEQ
ncbi:tetratricopeptide repeat protein [Alistipes ihumii]